MQIERVPGELWIGTVETIAAAHKLDEQRDSTLDDGLCLGKEDLVIGSRGGTLREQSACRSALTLSAGEKVCASCWEWSAVDQECSAAFDVKAWVRERSEGRNSWRGRHWRRRGRRVAWLGEDDGADGGEGEVGYFDHELCELRDQRVLRLWGKVLEDGIQTDTRDLHCIKIIRHSAHHNPEKQRKQDMPSR